MKKVLLIAAAALALSVAASACDSKKAQAETADALVEGAAEAESLSGADVSADEADVVAPADTTKDAKGYMTTATGLKYKVLKPGTGKRPASPASTVRVRYTGKKLDGTVFDATSEHGTPYDEFPLNRVIPGWTEGLQLMPEGAVYEFYIPAALAYGDRGTPGGPIGPNEDLIFEVELVKDMGVQQQRGF